MLNWLKFHHIIHNTTASMGLCTNK